MDDYLAEEVVNGTMTLDDALEQCEDAERMLKMVRLRKSMRNVLMAYVYKTKMLNSITKAQHFEGQIKIAQQLAQSRQQSIAIYFNRMESLDNSLELNWNTPATKMIIDDLGSVEKVLKPGRLSGNEQIVHSTIMNSINKATKNMNEAMKYGNMMSKSAMTGFLASFTEILDYLASNL